MSTMNAAVVKGAGQTPSHGSFEKPVAADGEHLVAVGAAAISPLTRMRAAGSHYSATGGFPLVAGADGVGRLEDGRRVYFLIPRAPFGAMADVTVVSSRGFVEIPDGFDDATAAAMANPGMSSWAALTRRAKMAKGQSVLINGATGSSGQMAVQIARHFGASKIIATGRSTTGLEAVAALGVDVTISLADDDATIEQALQEQFARGVDIVLDYLWGKSAELTLASAVKALPPASPVRFVQIGAISGANITLPGALLRSSAIEIMGSGLGSVNPKELMTVCAEMFAAAPSAGFKIDSVDVPLSQVEQAWTGDYGHRRVVVIPGE